MTPAQWSEENSQTFLDYGRYFVPEREQQLATICQLIPPQPRPFAIWELCCGEGLLAAALLAAHPTCTVIGYDGSPAMLAAAREQTARYADRFVPQPFDLAASEWRTTPEPPHAVVSSLAVHHLPHEQKAQLFGDLFILLPPGGVFVLADVMLPVAPQGWEVAAAAWDRAVQENARAIDGTLAAFAAFQRTGWNMYRAGGIDDVDKPAPLFDHLKWLEQAGFVGVDVHWLLAGHAIMAGYKPR